MSYPVDRQFERFVNNLALPQSDITRIADRRRLITGRINQEYWESTSQTAHSRFVGSYGRGTRLDSSDIDLLVELPPSVFSRFNSYSGNGQSALLQEVKNAIAKTYPTSRLRGDGQIVSIPFVDGLPFEVLPAFLCDDGSYLYPNSNNGGFWGSTDPVKEIEELAWMDKLSDGNLKNLCKMARAWRDANNVNVSGIVLDVLAYDFMLSQEKKDFSYLFYDWMSRDFFSYLASMPPTKMKWCVFGSGRYVSYSNSFTAKAKEAYEKAVDAISYAPSSEPIDEFLADYCWKDIYGSKWSYL